MKYSDEIKKEVVKMYAEGHSTASIAEKFNIHRAMVSRLAIDGGCAPRHKKRGGKRCNKCDHLNPAGSNYCNNCGADIRSEEELLMKEVEALRGLVQHLGDIGVREKADSITLDVMKYLRKRLSS